MHSAKESRAFRQQPYPVARSMSRVNRRLPYAELIQSLAGFEIGFIRSVCNQ